MATYGQCNSQHKCICKAHLKNNVLRKGGMDISKKPQDTQWGITQTQMAVSFNRFNEGS